MTIRQTLSKYLADAFVKLGYSPEYSGVTVSNRPDLCHYQCNGAMAAAKVYGKEKIEIAKEVAAELQESAVFSKVEAVQPGFINLSLSGEWLSEYMNKMNKDSRFLLPQMDKKTIVVDYGGPNIAKPLHVGHLRTAIIGDSLCKIASFLGHNVISDIHLGDWGLQMGLVIAEIEREHPNLPYFEKSWSGEYPGDFTVTANELNIIYPSASGRAKTDEAFAQRAAQITVDLQRGEKGYYALWKKIRDISVADLKSSYDTLGVDFDYWYGESDADPYIPRVISILEEKGLLRESDGAKIVDVALPDDKEPIPPIIVVKSNGGDIYGTTDLGTLLQRVEDWNPDELWYVTDARQALHFKQVFRCAALAGITPESTQCQHIYFGTMNGKDGKPYKTREGGVMRLSDLIENVVSNAKEKVASSDAVRDEKTHDELAKTIGMSALKIGDFVNNRVKDFIFDIDRFLDSNGKTGPYLQYACVRINSILEKAGFNPDADYKILHPSTKTEEGLMVSLLNVSDDLLRAYAEKGPSVVCESLFNIAGVFNRFYTETKILTHDDEKQKNSWLSLLSLTVSIMTLLLELLGIKVPDKM